MRTWLERLFWAEGFVCIIVLRWMDDERCISVLVDTGPGNRHLTREFVIEIESLMQCSEAQIAEQYIKPVVARMKEAM